MLARAAAVALTLWLVSPIVWAGHLEEITANLKMLAMAANQGDPMRVDLLTPLVSEYHYVTRLGVVLLLQAIERVFGETGDTGFHAAMMVSFAVVCASSLIVARRWSRVGTAAAAAALVATPGLFETAFFFNDNMISAAFALGALAVASRWNALAAYASAGAALAFAILCRTDAIVVAPLLAGLAWLEDARAKTFARRGAAAAIGALAVFGSAFLATHVSPLDSLALAKIFLPTSASSTRGWMALYFFGVPTLILIALGAPDRGAPQLDEARGRDWRAVFWLYPLLVTAIAIAKLSSEVRYVYPLLAPIIAIHAGAGVERILAAMGLSSSRKRQSGAWSRGALEEDRACQTPHRGVALLTVAFARMTPVLGAALIVLCLTAPPMVLTVHDGPRVLTGRLWSPLLWRRWQMAQARSMARVADLVGAINQTPATLVLAGHYNDEFFLKLRLMEDGYRPIPAGEAFPNCNNGFAVYVKPGHLVAHIRTDNQYGLVPWPRTAVRAVQVQRALQCEALWSVEAKFFTAVGANSWGGEPDAALFGPLLARLRPAESFSQTLKVPISLLFQPDAPARADEAAPLNQRVGEIETTQIDGDDLAAVNHAAARTAARYGLTYEDIAKTYRPIR